MEINNLRICAFRIANVQEATDSDGIGTRCNCLLQQSEFKRVPSATATNIMNRTNETKGRRRRKRLIRYQLIVEPKCDTFDSCLA